MIEIETYDEYMDVQYIINDATNISWSTHYGENGSGYGYLRFALPREVGIGYKDIGIGYRIKVRKYLNTILFDGQIRGIQESFSNGAGKISVSCLGWIAIAGDDEVNEAYCDKRINQWDLASAVPKWGIRPDLFSTSSNAGGLYIAAGNGKEFNAQDYVYYKYTAPGDSGYSQRIKCDVSICLGNGVLFDAEIASVDATNGYVYYTSDAGESHIDTGMELYNINQDKSATISAINTSTNRITVSEAGDISGWSASEDIVVYGPYFSAGITDISGAVITYGISMVGESNLAVGQMLANLTKKSTAEIQSVDTGANTITVTDEDHINGWGENDVIAVCAPYFEATISSISTSTIAYSSPVGERWASSATGWILHNVDQDNYATVQSWNAASNQLDVNDSFDISGWSATETIRIYSPFKAQVQDYNGAPYWPTVDVREGGVPQNHTSVDISLFVTPNDGWRLYFEGYLAGTANEYSFVNFTNIRAYAKTNDVTATFLVQEAIDALSSGDHGWSSDTDWVETSTKALEPAVFEFNTWEDVLSWACKYGDQNSDLLAWGLKLDDDKVVFLEPQTSANIDYVITRELSNMDASIDAQDAYQSVRGVYEDKLGERQLTSWASDSDAYLNKMYVRKKTIELDVVDTDSEASDLVQLYLSSNKEPKRSARYRVSGALTQFGLPVSADEVQATGRLMLVQDWRSVLNSGSDLTDEWTTERVVVVEVDYDNMTASVTPANARDDFERYMRELVRIAEGRR